MLAEYEGALVVTWSPARMSARCLVDSDAFGKLHGRPVLEQVLRQLPGRKAWIMERGAQWVSRFRLSGRVGDGSRGGPEGVRVCRSVDSMPVSPVILAG